MKKLSLLLLTSGLALPAFAQTKTLLNLDKTGVAIQGYDPVAFFTDNRPVKGKPEFPARHNGALYYFASKEHRELFEGDPAKYEPVFGGYCAYGVSRGKLVEIDVNAGPLHAAKCEKCGTNLISMPTYEDAGAG